MTLERGELAHPRTMPSSAWCSRGLSGEPLAIVGRPWVVVDVETTGLNPDRHCLREFAAVVLDAQFSVIAESVWHQDDGADQLSSALGNIECAVASGVVVAHNLRFDLAFLAADRLATRSGCAHPERWLCTLNVAHRRPLASMAADEEIENPAPHTALGDARTLAAWLGAVAARASVRDLDTVAGLVLAARPRSRSGRQQTVIATERSGWGAVADALDHAVPVALLTAGERSAFSDACALYGPGVAPSRPHEVAAVVEVLRRAGVRRLAFWRLLAEAGWGVSATDSWTDALPTD